MFTKVASRLGKLGGLLIVILISTHSPITFKASSPARVSSTQTQDKYRSEFDFISQTIMDCYSYVTIKQQRYVVAGIVKHLWSVQAKCGG